MYIYIYIYTSVTENTFKKTEFYFFIIFLLNLNSEFIRISSKQKYF